MPGDFSTAFAAFGIIGVGASELIYYPYWCLEKGYAKNVGTANPTEVWYVRAKGWLKVMRLDAWLSMVVYTGATVAFFLLGAALLHGPDMATDKVKAFQKDTMPKLAQVVPTDANGSFAAATSHIEAAVTFTEAQKDANKTAQIKGELAEAVKHLKAVQKNAEKKQNESEKDQASETIASAIKELELASEGVSNETMIADLSKMYRPLGKSGLTIFLIGAFVVLFSTLVTASASNARLLGDGLVLFQRIEKPKDDKGRAKLLSRCCIAIPVLCTMVYLFIPEPVTLVLLGGVAQALMLPLLAIAALYFRHKQTDKPLQPGTVWTAFLWLSAGAMVAVGLFQLSQKLG